MRMYGFLKDPYMCNKKDTVYKVMLHEIEGVGVYAYMYTHKNAMFSSFDSFYETLEDALGDWEEELDEQGWIEIDDPLPGCQHDAFLPIRVKGRDSGKPQWGQFEILEDGEWKDYQVYDAGLVRHEKTRFLSMLTGINWFSKSGTTTEAYHVIYSIFEAYDIWNQQTFDIWEPRICELEKKAQEILGDEQIDAVFEQVAETIGDKLWRGYCTFVERCHLEAEVGLESEIMDCVKRDVAWACIETMLRQEGFFTSLLKVYKEGYWPCSWQVNYPEGKLVVM